MLIGMFGGLGKIWFGEGFGERGGDLLDVWLGSTGPRLMI